MANRMSVDTLNNGFNSFLGPYLRKMLLLDSQNIVLGFNTNFNRDSFNFDPSQNILFEVKEF